LGGRLRGVLGRKSFGAKKKKNLNKKLKKEKEKEI